MEHTLWALIRFRPDDAVAFRPRAEAVADFWRAAPGCQACDLVQNVDDEGLWALVSRWDDVGSYRRSFAGFEAKVLLTPLLAEALDEPTAFLSPDLIEGGPRWT